jgi:prevent-host-death family protein
MVQDMTTYNIREFKAKISEIISTLEYDQEVIITRRGKPCGRLTPVQLPAEEKPSLQTLRGALTQLPDATYQDFVDIKTMWEPRVPPGGEVQRGRAG